ncbi:MAG: GGDEF domain-containing protein [Eubacteriales bacterium]|nr:GGDEF domain-containing protein [Eubacteriales bacterium]
MNAITELLLSNFTTIVLIIGLGIIAVTNKSFDTRTNRNFVAFVVLVAVLLAADMMDYILTASHQVSVLRYMTSALGYTLRPSAVVIILQILLRRKKAGIVLWIPVILVGVVAFTSIFTHVMFWFGERNEFMQGPLCYLPHIVSAFYLAVVVVLTIRMYRSISPGEIFAVIYIVSICVIAAVLESVLSGYKFLVTGAMMTSCTLYYVVLYLETFRRDSLTGLMNRRSFFADAQRMRSKTIAVISIDLNALKEINDLHGHSAGDKALQSVAGAMMKRERKNFAAYRVGGDEFMALGKEQTQQAAEAYMQGMREALKACGLTASFGYESYRPGDDFDSICNRADVHMYEDKREYKRECGFRGGGR